MVLTEPSADVSDNLKAFLGLPSPNREYRNLSLPCADLLLEISGCVFQEPAQVFAAALRVYKSCDVMHDVRTNLLCLLTIM